MCEEYGSIGLQLPALRARARIQCIDEAAIRAGIDHAIGHCQPRDPLAECCNTDRDLPAFGARAHIQRIELAIFQRGIDHAIRRHWEEGGRTRLTTSHRELPSWSPSAAIPRADLRVCRTLSRGIAHPPHH